MTPKQFLERWKSDHIDSGTQQADADILVKTMLADADEADIPREMLERAAGLALEDYIAASIREAIEEELR